MTQDSALSIPPGELSRHDAPTRLHRAITGPLLYLFILGDVLGAGIYALMGVLAGDVGGMLWAPILLALALALLTAGSYAELVTKYPRAGGAAVFAQRAFRLPVISFLVGFSMLAAGVTSAAGLALAFSGDYLGALIEIPPLVTALVFLAIVAAVNARGIRESLQANVVMTLIELVGLVVVVVVVFVFVIGGGGDASRLVELPDGAVPSVAILAASIVAFYSFVGFEVSANVAEEVRNPSATYPRALFGALLTAGAMYALVAIASAIALPADELADTSAPLLSVVQSTGAGIPDWAFSVVALVAVANGALLTMIMASRLTYGMAEQKLLPSALGRVLPRRRTPWVAIVATTAVAMVLASIGTLELLAETVVLLLLVVFISTNISVLVLRRDTVEHGHFRVWTVVPVLGVLSCLVLLSQQSLTVWLSGGVLLAIGAALHGITVLARRRQKKSGDGVEA